MSEHKDALQFVDDIIDAFEVEGPHGMRYFYITHCGIRLVSKYGCVLSFLFDDVVRYGAKHNQFRIDWIRNDAKMYHEIKAEMAQKISDAYQKRNKEYAESISEIEGVIRAKKAVAVSLNLHC